MSEIGYNRKISKGFNLFRSKVYQFVNLYVPQLIENKSKDLLLYGSNNCFPNDLLKTISESGTATSCVNKLDQFIQADGFLEESTSKTQVNKTETADKLLNRISSCVANFDAFPLYILRSADAKIASAELLDFECVRKRISGDFVFNAKLGTKEYKESEDKIYPSFKKEITKQEFAAQLSKYGQVGEVYYVYRKKTGQNIYPIPGYYAGIEDVKTDAELSKFEYETAVNSFITSAILTIIGNVDNTVKDDKGKTDQEYLDETLSDFTGGKKDSSGMSGRNKLTVLSAKTKEEVPVLQNFDTKAIMDAANGATDRIARKVARIFEVPPFLIGLESATGFNTKILVDQIDLFNKTINSKQRMISDALKVVFPDNDWAITTFNPINYIPSEVYAKLTGDEIRATGGYKPIDKKITSETENTINAINSLSPLVANKVLESLSEDEIRSLIGLKPKQITNVN